MCLYWNFKFLLNIFFQIFLAFPLKGVLGHQFKVWREGSWTYILILFKMANLKIIQKIAVDTKNILVEMLGSLKKWFNHSTSRLPPIPLIIYYTLCKRVKLRHYFLNVRPCSFIVKGLYKYIGTKHTYWIVPIRSAGNKIHLNLLKKCNIDFKIIYIKKLAQAASSGMGCNWRERS